MQPFSPAGESGVFFCRTPPCARKAPGSTHGASGCRLRVCVRPARLCASVCVLCVLRSLRAESDGFNARRVCVRLCASCVRPVRLCVLCAPCAPCASCVSVCPVCTGRAGGAHTIFNIVSPQTKNHPAVRPVRTRVGVILFA